MDSMIIDNVVASNIDLAGRKEESRILKRTLSDPGVEDICRKRCRCENCRAEYQQQRDERKAEIALRKVERMAVRLDRLAAKIEREAAKAERKAAKEARMAVKDQRKSSKVPKPENTEGGKEKTEGGQTHELSKHFLQLAPSAYAPDTGEKILAKGFSKIVIDGNNLLFITDALRKNTLHGKRKRAEKILSIAALAFSQLVGVTTEVIFDQTHLPRRRDASLEDGAPRPSLSKSSIPDFNTEIANIAKEFPVVGVPLLFTDGTSVLVSSARPGFATTDDKLISWARQNSQTVAPTSGLRNSDIVVVSSDRALAGELYSLGVSLIKPGSWIALLASLLGEGEQSGQKGALFKWFDSYCLSLSSE